jgi:hypothetical protein
MAVGQGGYSTNGVTIATAADLNGDMLVSVDTQAANGASPQTIAVPLGLLGSQMNIGVIGATAFAGGGQASATQLDYGINTVTVVATAADSVKLPPAVLGATVFIRIEDASGADSCTVFGYGTDTIDGVASATGNAQADTKGKLYVCTSGDGDGVAGTWVTLLGA